MGSELTTTLRELRQYRACEDRYAVLVEALGPGWGDDDPIPLRRIYATNGAADAIWALRACPGRERIAMELAVTWGERALQRERAAGREPDPRSWAAVEVARRYARGEASVEEFRAAHAAAHAAARAAAWAATWAAARAAAWAADAAAAWAAIDAAATRAAAEAATRAADAATWATANAAAHAAYATACAVADVAAAAARSAYAANNAAYAAEREQQGHDLLAALGEVDCE
jgi:hypothetical protein